MAPTAPTAVTANGEAAVLRRAGLLRLARRAAAALARRGAAPARVAARAARGEALLALWRGLPSGALALELSVPAALLAASAVTALDAALARALDRARPGPAYPRPAPAAPAKALLFRSLLECPGKEGADRVNQGTLYLASALRAAGVPVVLSDAKVSRFAREPAMRADLERLLALHPDVGLVALSLYDAYFEEARELARFVRARTRARLALGALMPTREPAAALAHFAEADLVGRGAGEGLLPRLAALAGASRSGPFDDAARGALLELDGTLAADAESAVWAGAERVPRAPDLDASVLDFSFLERRDAGSGATFCLSRGCGSACRFCTSPDQGRFHGKSPRAVGRVLVAYGRRVRELYGSWSAAPVEAFGLGFYDDDFLGDPERAVAVLALVRASPFHLRFLQTGIASFFRGGAARGAGPDARLVAALDPELFEPKRGRGAGAPHPHLYLGTESFCDAELERLGKGYGTAQVEAVARALSARGVRQAHHFIASNACTRPEDVRESLERIARLRRECGGSFGLLEPVIGHLMSFPGTARWRDLERRGLLGRVALRGRLRVPGFPELDYPLVDRDVPLDPGVAAWADDVARRPPGVDWAAEPERARRLLSAAAGGRSGS